MRVSPFVPAAPIHGTVCASQQRDDRLPARNSRLLGISSMKCDFPASSVLRDLRPSFQFEFD